MSEKIYLAILKSGILASFFIIFFIFRDLLFPYISSKQLPFDILMEVLFVFWLAFIIKYPSYNPFKKNSPLERGGAERQGVLTQAWSFTKNNLVTISLFIFLLGLLASLITTVDFNLSFWGDIERMLGIFQVAHFIIFYLIIITVFKSWRDWNILLATVVVSALGTSFLSVFFTRNSTLGNAAYVAIFAIFGFYFAFILFFNKINEVLKKQNLYKWLYLLFIPIFIWALRSSNITGDYIGLATSLFVFFFALALLNKNKKIKIIAGSILLVLIGTVILIFANRQNPIISQNAVLKGFSANKNTFQTRLISWRGAIKDFPNHWLLGTGYQNYAITFDKNFDPNFYNYSRTETYFDHAHNIVIDFASTTGIVGLAGYLFMLFAGIFYSFKVFRSGRINSLEFALILSLFVAYFVQNLAIFDSLASYLGLMVLLGYLNWLATSEKETGSGRAIDFLPLILIPLFFIPNLPSLGMASLLYLAIFGWIIIFFFFPDNKIKEKNFSFNKKEIISLIILVLIIGTSIYKFSVLPWKMMTGVIDGERAFSDGQPTEAIKDYQQAFKYDTPVDRDGRSMFLRSFVTNTSSLKSLKTEELTPAISFAISLAEENNAYNEGDCMAWSESANLYNSIAMLSTDKNEKVKYMSEAYASIDKAILASPGRIPLYFTQAHFLASLGNIDGAISTLEYSAKLNNKFYEADCELGQMYLIKSLQEKTTNNENFSLDENKAYQHLDICLNHNGANNLVIEAVVSSAINHYAVNNDYPKLVGLYENLTRFQGQNPKVWTTLASLYAKVGNKQKAILAANQATKLDPSLKNDTDEFIKTLK